MNDMAALKKALFERFLRYVTIETESLEGAGCIPSTEKQWDLARMIRDEMTELRLSDVRLSDNCYVYGRIPANADVPVPSLGLIAHMDTVSSLPGKCCPRIIENYDGSDIPLDPEGKIITRVSDFPDIRDFQGKTLIVTDGTTVLGADDKAGIAEIMTMAQYLMEHPEIKHGDICIGFTPDEETGHGADMFDVKGFGADLAFTVDGADVGELEYENFNAAEACIRVKGFGVHTGSAKGKLKNAASIAMELRLLLPEAETPEHTEGYEGFYHITSVKGDVESAELHLIIRDHDRKHFEERKAFLENAVSFLNGKYGESTLNLEIRDQYYNMKEMIEPHMELIDLTLSCMQELDITPRISPIRGGTDGARLSFMGIPCPNLGTGSRYHHGRYETACLEDMTLSVLLLINICQKIFNFSK